VVVEAEVVEAEVVAAVVQAVVVQVVVVEAEVVEAEVVEAVEAEVVEAEVPGMEEATRSAVEVALAARSLRRPETTTAARRLPQSSKRGGRFHPR
jgi:hypothetical protein